MLEAKAQVSSCQPVFGTHRPGEKHTELEWELPTSLASSKAALAWPVSNSSNSPPDVVYTEGKEP